MRVLLDAHFCNPRLQSVSLIGYKWLRELQGLCELTLITHARNREALESEFRGGTRALFVETGKISDQLWTLSQSFPTRARSLAEILLIGYLDYRLYAIEARKMVRREMAERAFDVYHRVTPVTVLSQSFIPHLGIPSIIGPLNYNMDWPPGFQRSAHAAKFGQSPLHRLMASAGRSTAGSSFRRYRKILVASKNTEAAVPASDSSKCVRFVENGVDTDDFTYKIHDRKPVQCLYVGRLIPVKAIDILIEGFRKALASDPDLRLTIVGDGYERAHLEGVAVEMIKSGHVRFTGEIPNKETARYFQDADIFLLSSLREAGGGVILEAMSCGAVPVVVDHGGPAEVVNDEVGIKLKPVSSEQLADDFSKSILRLAGDTALRHRMAAAGRRFVENGFDWRTKAKTMVELYVDTVKNPL